MGARAVFTNEKQRLVLSSGMSISPAQATLFGFSGLMERMYGELINKMIDLHIDSFELACLRGIILFNPGKLQTIDCKKLEILPPQQILFLTSGR